ncbi:hypothetical protein BT69DRAFT_1288881 [Atractiella rhizophila]|nr:hypothetical protein BT69DRAFT_1288881 [Atractiella rhizophila]
MFSLKVTTLLSLSFINLVVANDPISQAALDSQGLYPFVLASRPRWLFGVPSAITCPFRTGPCYADYAVDPQTGAQNPGADLQGWPKADGGCRAIRDDGKAGGAKGKPFPSYYIVNQCASDEVRVGYWLYFPKDGFKLTGHRHDWEYYIVVWKKDGSGNYYRDRHVQSYHSGRIGTPWSQVKDTVNDDLTLAANGNGNHASIYVAWSKHAMFDTKKTDTICESLLQSTLVAYRSDDWYYYAEESDLVVGDRSSQIGVWIDDIGQAGSWGDATSWPHTSGGDGRICSLEATQNGRLANPELGINNVTDVDESLFTELFPFGLPDEVGKINNGLGANSTSPLSRVYNAEFKKRFAEMRGRC